MYSETRLRLLAIKLIGVLWNGSQGYDCAYFTRRVVAAIVKGLIWEKEGQRITCVVHSEADQSCKQIDIGSLKKKKARERRDFLYSTAKGE